MELDQSKRLKVTLTALRGVVMIAAGLAAFMFPALAVKLVLLAGGGLLLVDSGLSLAATDYSARRDNAFYLSVGRNIACVVAGLIVLLAYFLTGVFSLSFLAGTVGLLLIVAGLIEIGAIMMDRAQYADPMIAMVGGAVYIAVGLALMFMPLSSAAVLMQLVVAALIVYAAILLYRAWKLRSSY